MYWDAIFLFLIVSSFVRMVAILKKNIYFQNLGFLEKDKSCVAADWLSTAANHVWLLWALNTPFIDIQNMSL